MMNKLIRTPSETQCALDKHSSSLYAVLLVKGALQVSPGDVHQ